jgi:hypothetical protein
MTWTQWARSIIAVCGVAAACSDAPTNAGVETLVVVQAYLYAGEPVSDVRLTASVPLGSDSTESPPINDADVVLYRSGQAYRLTPADTDGTYAYTGTDLTIASGDTFRIEVTYNGTVVSGETVVPEPPRDVAISSSTLVVPDFTTPPTGGGPPLAMDSAQVVISWTSPERALHYVVVRGPAAGSDPIFPENSGPGGPFSRFRMITQPTADDYYSVGMQTLRDLGRHEAMVYRVNKEYADLYENRTQDSRDLTEPPTNIRNGLGVFTAFTSRVVVFDVVRN